MVDPTRMNADELREFVSKSVPGLVEDKKEAKRRKVCFAILAYDAKLFVRTHVSLVTSILRCMMQGWEIAFINRDSDSMVARGRNYIASQFLENPQLADCSDLVMIDTDLGWVGAENGDEVVRLLSHPVDVVGGAYPYKDDSGNFPLQWPADGLMEENGLWRVKSVTPGFLRVTRKALETIVREMPWIEYKDTPNKNGQRSWMFFDNLQRSSGVYDEGYIFCERWRQVGGTVWLDPDLDLTHIGLKAYNHGTIRQWLDRKAQTFEKLESEYPGVPPLKLIKAAMGEKDVLPADDKQSAA
jgi:hypothetical protein